MKLARVLAMLSVLALGTSLAACSDSGNAGTGSTSLGGPSGGGSATGLIDALCTALHSCCVADGKESSRDACVTFYTALSANAKLGPNAAACESYLRQHAGDGQVCEGGLQGDDDICEDALELNDKGSTPKRALGQTCDFEDDCAVATPGAKADCRHDFNGGSTVTACVELVTVQAGAPCGYSMTDDGYPSQVFGSSTPSDDPPTYTYGICQFKDGLFCDGTTRTCKAFGNIGEPCTGFDSCVKAATCQYEQSSSKQVCVARAAIGEACSNSSSESCVEGAACKDKICVAQKKAGEACALSSDCLSSYCKDAKCEGNGGSSGSGLICFTAK